MFLKEDYYFSFLLCTYIQHYIIDTVHRWPTKENLLENFWWCAFVIYNDAYGNFFFFFFLFFYNILFHTFYIFLYTTVVRIYWIEIQCKIKMKNFSFSFFKTKTKNYYKRYYKGTISRMIKVRFNNNFFSFFGLSLKFCVML